MNEQIQLREVTAADLPLFFEQQLDPEANYNAAFVFRDPTDEAVFKTHWAKLLTDENIIVRTILFDGKVAGHISRFEWQGKPEITYWLGKEYWRKGIATSALTEFLQQLKERPLYAAVVKDNIASLRVLEKCGFKITGSGQAFAPARDHEVEEIFLELN